MGRLDREGHRLPGELVYDGSLMFFYFFVIHFSGFHYDRWDAREKTLKHSNLLGEPSQDSLMNISGDLPRLLGFL
jgi:hypothetical protein